MTRTVSPLGRLACWIGLVSCLAPAGRAADLFRDRILPLARSPEASSCTECHLSGVDLRAYVKEDERSTFAALRDAGLIDVDHPEQSKLLQFIARRPDHPDPLTDRVRHRELEAFSAWIDAAVRDPRLLAVRPAGRDVGDVPAEVIRHARKDRVVSRFIDSIWSEIGRCQNCHSPDRNRHQIGRLTEDEVAAISWIVPRDPAATLEKLLAAGAIDLEQPEESLVLTKPTARVEHGGGAKFLPGSDTYRQFARFLDDYAAIRSGRYRAAADLPEAPAERVLLTEQQLRITGIPARFAGLSLQVDLFAWDAAAGTWEARRCGTGFSRVHPRDGVWQNQILLVLPGGAAHAPPLDPLLLPAGRYRAEILVDATGRTAAAPRAALSRRDRVGVVELSGPWPPGYQPPKIVAFPGPN